MLRFTALLPTLALVACNASFPTDAGPPTTDAGPPTTDAGHDAGFDAGPPPPPPPLWDSGALPGWDAGIPAAPSTCDEALAVPTGTPCDFAGECQPMSGDYFNYYCDTTATRCTDGAVEHAPHATAWSSQDPGLCPPATVSVRATGPDGTVEFLAAFSSHDFGHAQYARYFFWVGDVSPATCPSPRLVVRPDRWVTGPVDVEVLLGSLTFHDAEYVVQGRMVFEEVERGYSPNRLDVAGTLRLEGEGWIVEGTFTIPACLAMNRTIV